MPKRESSFQSYIIRTLRAMVEPDGFVLVQDGSYIQGFPDILILYKDRWAALECKRHIDAHEQPNQRYYINLINEKMTFASFISPENEEEVINDLQQALRIR